MLTYAYHPVMFSVKHYFLCGKMIHKGKSITEYHAIGENFM